ncbi:hypothetical protein V502_02238 [Pseudogymnoascus sp. VKM F-4520 (FW-2644)]|nr:hypothetical protein V502_02238 [Pseudogymnoascus sp. VKM F-4520 (FW-2644)]
MRDIEPSRPSLMPSRSKYSEGGSTGRLFKWSSRTSSSRIEETTVIPVCGVAVDMFGDPQGTEEGSWDNEYAKEISKFCVEEDDDENGTMKLMMTSSGGSIEHAAPKFEETPVVAIKQGGTAEAAISGVIEMIDSMINQNLVLVAHCSPWGEMVKE